MDQFGPPDHAGLVASREPDIVGSVDALLRALPVAPRSTSSTTSPIPFPVAVICEVLGVPTGGRVDVSRVGPTPW